MLYLHLNNQAEHKRLEHASGPIEFGRGPARGDLVRCVVQDKFVSRDHLRVEETPDGQVVVENLSQKNRVRLVALSGPGDPGDGEILEPGARRTSRVPLRLALGETVIDVERPGSRMPNLTVEEPAVPVGSLQTIAVPVRPGATAFGPSRLADGVPGGGTVRLGTSPTPEVLTGWFETVIAVQRAAASSPEFYRQTAQAVVDLVGLDRGLVLLRPAGDAAGGRSPERWEVAARYPPSPDGDDERAGSGYGREFSLTILRNVVNEGRTFYQPMASLPAGTESLQGVEAVVASPIFDARDQVIGALYGLRNRFAPSPGGQQTPSPSEGAYGIGALEAQLVQLLASAVGAGLARLEQETEAARLRVQFEQFLSAGLVHELQRNPHLLEGQEREVTVLLCDIRGFSRLAESLGPRDTCRWLANVLDHLVARVKEYEGVLVDYTGDGFMAMWNAPADQPDHAARACRAALAMLGDLPGIPRPSAVREGRGEKVADHLGLGVGLNTGPALVGNVGSRYRFKYGPLGHTVNLASRVESATKHLGVPVLITGSTQARLGGAFATRRLGKVRVAGVEGVTELYELRGESVTPDWEARREGYEAALAHFEQGRWAEACRVLYPLIGSQAGQYDLPSLDLVARAVECLKAPPEPFEPVKTLMAK